MSSDKPHKGRIIDWCKYDCGGEGLGYLILGRFIDHPDIPCGKDTNTSYVVAHDKETGEIETRNSRYTLVGPEAMT